MIPLFTPEQVRGFDERAYAGGVRPEALMELAAGHLARAVLGVGGHGYGLRVGILCGKGNNGGDGLAAGRRLLDAGAQPRIHLLSGEDGLGEQGVAQLRRYRAAGGRLVAAAAEVLDGADVAVDCLLGTGVSGEPREPYATVIGALNDWGTARPAVVA
nr:bifunctional ADP-dependent NAD(P)H-hydrate dehydratase/NAD(P)H-hydrate epimerase [Euzebyales bacterium]